LKPKSACFRKIRKMCRVTNHHKTTNSHKYDNSTANLQQNYLQTVSGRDRSAPPVSSPAHPLQSECSP
jgi:hypothetical protein